MHIEDEASHIVLVRQEGVRANPLHGLADVLVDVRKASTAQAGRWPTSSSSSCRKSSVRFSRPQPVWWMSITVRVPRARWLMVSERIVSSVTTPPALRIV